MHLKTLKDTRTFKLLGEHLGTRRALGHLGHSGTWTIGHLRHSGTWALRALRHLGTWTLKTLGHLGTRLLDALYLADSRNLQHCTKLHNEVHNEEHSVLHNKIIEKNRRIIKFTSSIEYSRYR